MEVGIWLAPRARSVSIGEPSDSPRSKDSPDVRSDEQLLREP